MSIQFPTADQQPEPVRPSSLLDVDADPVLSMLEELDDVVFAALAGCQDSLERTRKLWPQVVEALGWELVDESREQYMRFAVETTRRLQNQEMRSPEHSLAALEVMSLLAC